MEMSLRCIALVLVSLLYGCTATNIQPEKELKFTKLGEVTKLNMRKVEVTISDDGEIIMSTKNYENLSKNLSDIFANYKLMKEKNNFYERQMFNDDEVKDE